jgi:hypothetical protein
MSKAPYATQEEKELAIPIIKKMRDEKGYHFKRIGQQFGKSAAWANKLYHHGSTAKSITEPLPLATSKPIELLKETILPPPIISPSTAPTRKESVSLVRALKYLNKEQLIDYILKSK